MSSAYYFSMGLTVLSNVAYQFCQKGIAPDANPLVSLLATYLTAIAVTLLVLLLTGSADSWSAATWGRLTWTSYMLGVFAVGLEFGFLWAYRAGWKLSVAALYSNACVTLVLLPVGFLLFHDGMTLRKGAGVLLVLSGLWFVGGG